jgi:L-threonylcarbamoyladenylate synthase
MALELIKHSGCPIAAPSANMFGAISATTALAVQQEFGNRCPFLLDGGPCSVGLESTVISFLGETPTLLRPGGIPLEEITAVIGTVIIPDDQKQQQLSPGRLASHYAPRTPLYLLPESLGRITHSHSAAWKKFIEGKAWQIIQNNEADLAKAASALFETMRTLDQNQLDFILAEPFPQTGLGFAISDRLKRAASGSITISAGELKITAKGSAG